MNQVLKTKIMDQLLKTTNMPDLITINPDADLDKVHILAVLNTFDIEYDIKPSGQITVPILSENKGDMIQLLQESIPAKYKYDIS